MTTALRQEQYQAMKNSIFLYHIGKVSHLSPTFAYMRQAFCPCQKLLSHMTMLVLGTIHLKVGEKESIMSQSMQDREMSS